MARYLKLCFKGEEDCIKLISLPYDFNELKAAIKNFDVNVDFSKIRIYWIDDEGDKIAIDCFDSYGIFWEKCENKKIIVEAKEPNKKVTFTPTTENRTFAQQTEDGSSGKGDSNINSDKIEHEKVECDGCGDSPIIGFRYKCIQCPNLDLCMKCEEKMLHKHHMMLRIPIPLGRCHIDRSFFKKVKKGGFMRSEDVDEEARTRHGGHHRRHSSGTSGTKQNIFSHLYTMMNDLAEGTEVPSYTKTSNSKPRCHSVNISARPEAEVYINGLKAHSSFLNLFDDINNANATPNPQNQKAQQEPQQQQEGQQEQEQQKQQQKQESPKNQERPKSFQNCKIDPNYTVQILSNLNEMFGKILDPLGINIEVDFDSKTKQNEQEEKSDNNTETRNKPEEESKNDATTDGNENEKAPSAPLQPEPTAVTITPEVSTSAKVVENIAESNTPLVNNPQEKSDLNEKKKDSMTDETGWTLVDKSSVEEKSQQQEEGAVGGVDRATQATDINYRKLSQDLWNHIENSKVEKTDKAKEDMKTDKPKEEIKTENRYQIVHHPKPHINNAVIAMMAMGFSNEGNWLTQLLDSVDGDISQALDLMKPAK